MTFSESSCNVLVIGSGLIGCEYVKVVHSLGVRCSLLVRGAIPQVPLPKIELIEGDALFLDSSILGRYSHIIVATQPRYTFKILSHLLTNTCAKLLVEKPISLFSHQVQEIDGTDFDERVFVAFNRRFFESVAAAKAVTEKNAILGATACFTEHTDRMRGAQCEVERWAMCNTIHLFDTIFYLTGIPDQVSVSKSLGADVKSYFVTGSLNQGTIFLESHWGGPGNWGISITTLSEKLVLDPLESLTSQYVSSFEKKNVIIPAKERQFKDGFLKQSLSFLSGDKSKFISYEDYVSLANFIEVVFYGKK